jgi:hypothetical protein
VLREDSRAIVRASQASKAVGSFSLAEMTAVRLRMGLGIERDILFEGLHPISAWAEAARRAGGIREAERMLHAVHRSTRADPSAKA